MPYEVSTPVFSGPFDLLLHLIAKEEVDIYEVSLSRIVDEYLAELARMERLDLDVTTEFLLIAATLVELKARRLLPVPDFVDLDEELLLYEQRDLLLARLLECKTFKNAAEAIDALRRAAARSVARTAGPEEPLAALAPDPLAAVRPGMLGESAWRALSPRPDARVILDHVTPIRVSVRDALATVLERLPDRGTITFRLLTADATGRLDVVVRFLAVLELFKQGVVDLEQASTFSELVVRRQEGLDLDALDEWDATDGHDAPVQPRERGWR